MKAGVMICVALFIAGILLALLQMWFSPWTPLLFSKLMTTLGAAFLIALILLFVVREYGETKRMKNGGSLDD